MLLFIIYIFLSHFILLNTIKDSSLRDGFVKINEQLSEEGYMVHWAKATLFQEDVRTTTSVTILHSADDESRYNQSVTPYCVEDFLKFQGIWQLNKS